MSWPATWWERHVLNRSLEAVMDVPVVHAERARVLAAAAGDVLEVGVGTGLNLPWYPPSVTRIVAVTRDATLEARAAARAAARGLTVEHLRGDAEALPVEAARFDTVVCTFLLCSVRDPARAARELRRVLRPSGRLIVLEHVIAPRGARRLLQRGFDPISRLVNCGCSTVRDTAATLRAAGFVLAVDERDVPGMPLLYRHVIAGGAT